VRLLYVTPRYLPHTGGTEVHTAEVATRMAARGHDVTVLSTHPVGRGTTDQWLDGVLVRRVPAWPPDRDYYLAPALAGEIRSTPWSLVHVQGYHTAVAPLAMSAAARAGVPFVLTFHSGGHSSVVRRALRPVQHRLLERLARNAERLIGVSAWETEHFMHILRLPPERFVTIPNGVDLPTLSNAVPLDVRADPMILSIGRLERYKGHQSVIDAMPQLRYLLPGASLTIVGTGPYEDALRRRVRRRGVEDIVHFTSVPVGQRERMGQLITSASLVVSLSSYESQGLAVQEALGLGRPVLVANATAFGELAAMDGVRAIPPRSSPETVAAAVVRSIGDARNGKAPTLPRWEDIADSLEELYSTIVEAQPCES
jgi:glycosyltransferase involved in cell wall biosynthesis